MCFTDIKKVHTLSKQYVWKRTFILKCEPNVLLLAIKVWANDSFGGKIFGLQFFHVRRNPLDLSLKWKRTKL